MVARKVRVEDTSSNKKPLLIAAGAIAALGTAALIYYLTTRRSSGDDDEDHTAAFSKTAKKAAAPAKAAATTPAPAPAAAAAPAAPKKPAMSTTASAEETMSGLQTEYSFRGTDALHRVNTDDYLPPGVADSQGRVNFPHLSVTLQLPAKWKVNEEVSPMPSVSLVTFSHDDFGAPRPGEGGAPGEVPMVVLSVEDTSAECLNLEEFKEKSKQMGMAQLHMMTNGMFTPQLVADEEASVGAFKRMIEYSLNTPFFEMRVINYFAMLDGVAYTMQLMVKPSLLPTVRGDFTAIARGISLTSRLDAHGGSPVAVSFIKLPVAAAERLVIQVPSNWVATTPAVPDHLEAIFPSDALAALAHTPSVMKQETVVVYRAKDGSAITPQDATLKTLISEKKVETKIGSVTASEWKLANGRYVRFAAHPNGAVYVVLAPAAAARLVTSLETLAHIAASFGEDEEPISDAVQPCTSEANFARFYSNKFGCSFAVRRNGRVIENRVGEPTIMYGPLGSGIPSAGGDVEAAMRDAEEHPFVTIRVGDPSNDPDCRASLDEWEERVREDMLTEDGAATSDLKRERLRDGREVLSFKHKAMVEVGEGRAEERVAKMYVLLHGDRTTLVRWEAPTGVFARYENMMKDMINSIRTF